jgi:hypothetical protein
MEYGTSKGFFNVKELTQDLIFHSDAGHGWLAVPKKVIDWLGLRPSQYSYFNHKTNVVYLEEDSDASAFVAFAKSKGMTLNIKDQDDGDSSPIRRLSRCGL